MNCIGFPPSIDSSCRILILGSMPGVRSLEEQQYYAHPQNRFWPLMARLLGEREAPAAYEDRLRMLLRRHIALWDSIWRIAFMTSSEKLCTISVEPVCAS